MRLLFVFMKAITLRHVSNCHFERSEAESRNLLPPCSPLHWPHSIERNAGSFLRKELGGALRIGPRNFLNFFSSRGSKNRTFRDISIRGMKRTHEMMNSISKLPPSTSAVRRRAEERRNIREFHFSPLLLLKSADDRQKTMQYPKNRRQKSNKEERSQDFPLFSDKYRAAPMYVGGPRRGRRIYWLNLPGDSS